MRMCMQNTGHAARLNAPDASYVMHNDFLHYVRMKTTDKGFVQENYLEK